MDDSTPRIEQQDAAGRQQFVVRGLWTAADLTGKAVWNKFGGEDGTPDGMTLDRDGNVWVAFWGGSCIRQFTPQGSLLRTIPLPAPQITSMAFGGKNLDLLLVTSARVDLDDATLEAGTASFQLANFNQASLKNAKLTGLMEAQIRMELLFLRAKRLVKVE